MMPCTICWGHFYKAMPKACSTELGPTGSPCWCKAPSGTQNLSSIYRSITRLPAPSGLLFLTAHLSSSGICTSVQDWLLLASHCWALVLNCSPGSTSKSCGNTPTIESMGWKRRLLTLEQWGQQKFPELQSVVSSRLIQQLSSHSI